MYCYDEIQSRQRPVNGLRRSHGRLLVEVAVLLTNMTHSWNSVTDCW